VDVVPVDQSYSQAGASTSYSWTSYPRISHIRKLAPACPTRGRRSGRSVPLSLRVLYVVRRRQRPQSAARRRIRPRLRTVRSVQRYKNYAINYDKWSKNFYERPHHTFLPEKLTISPRNLPLSPLTSPPTEKNGYSPGDPPAPSFP